MPVPPNVFTYQGQAPAGKAHLRIDPTTRLDYTVSPQLLGKFCEHLGANIYHGMDAQILFNCTFGRWRFSAGDGHPDGGVQEETDRTAIARQIAHLAQQRDWRDPDFVGESTYNGSAFGWVPVGDTDCVSTSPETGPHGDRAQRVEVAKTASAQASGIGQ